MKRPGRYAPLSDRYYDDVAIMRAGEHAELLFVRMLSYAAGCPETDGWISDAVVTSRLGIMPIIVGGSVVPGTDAEARAVKLAEVGLIARDGDGWRLVSWLKWNKSGDEIDASRASDRRRKTPKPETGPENAPENAPETGPEVCSETGPETGPEKVPETGDIEQSRAEQSRARSKTLARTASDSQDRFGEFWQEYPKKVDKRAAQKAWRSAMKRASPESIIEGASRYTQQCEMNRTEQKYRKNPSTWLNADSWSNPVLIDQPGKDRQQSRIDAITVATIQRGQAGENAFTSLFNRGAA